MAEVTVGESPVGAITTEEKKMRDLEQEELGSVYGAGGWRRWCPPKKSKGRKGSKGSKGGSSGGRGKKRGKGASTS